MSTEPKQCLLCGSAKSTKFNYRPNLSGEGEVCRLYHEIQDLDILVTDIIPVQRIYLLRRINDYRGSVARLPNETLYEIFELACWFSRLDTTIFGRRGSNHFQVVLSGVSSRWRTIMHSSPLFWTTLSLTFHEQGGRQLYNRIALLRLYLKHSESVLLDLKFSFSFPEDTSGIRSWPRFDTLIHHTIDNILLANFHRIRLLHLEKASLKWISAAPKLTQIESFRFSRNPTLNFVPPVLSFPNTRHLHELTIFDWPSIDVKSKGWRSLTTLILESIEINVCVGLLAECTKLVEFRCRSPKNLGVSSWFPLCQPWEARVTRESLETFEWSMPHTGRPGRVELSMLQFIHMPVLQSLKIGVFRHSQYNAVRVFFQRLPTTLSSLYLSMICDNTETQDHCLFKYIPIDCVVDEMTFCITCGSTNVLAHAFSWLEDPTHFPKLKRMTVESAPCTTRNNLRNNFRNNLMLPSSFAQLIHKMIASRVPPLPEFCMKFFWITVDWPSDVRDALWGLVNKHGLRLNIQEDKNLFNSLPHICG